MFGTSGIRGPVGETVTAGLGVDLGLALADWGAERVVVGRDPRLTGEYLADAVSAGLREGGADVVDLGVASTPTIARSVAPRDADAGVAVTASHNPPEDNGFKLWLPSGKAFGPTERDAIAERLEVETIDRAAWDETGERTTDESAADRHVEALVAATDPVDDLRVAVDVGNGAGGVTARALDRLGCDVRTLNAQPDGRFPARPSEPTPENCEHLADFVAASDADLGIAHDGDADRTRAVDENGRFLSGDVTLAIFGRAVAAPGDAVVAPVDTSLAVDDALADVGASVERTRVGDVFVAERAAEAGAVFGGEPSGAWIWPDETLCPDGPLAACRLAALADAEGPVSALADAIETYPIARDSVETSSKAAVMEAVATAVADRYDDVSTIDGVRVDAGDGWFLIRASGTQPLVRVTAEARDANRRDELFETARGIVETERGRFD